MHKYCFVTVNICKKTVSISALIFVCKFKQQLIESLIAFSPKFLYWKPLPTVIKSFYRYQAKNKRPLYNKRFENADDENVTLWWQNRRLSTNVFFK